MSGRPILGVIAGFFFGLLGGLALWLWGVVPLHSDLLIILPIVGIILGLAMAWWAPFGKPSEPPAITSLPLSDPPPPDPAPESSD